MRSALPQAPALNRPRLPEPVKETRLDRTRPTTADGPQWPAPQPRKPAAPQARQARRGPSQAAAGPAPPPPQPATRAGERQPAAGPHRQDPGRRTSASRPVTQTRPKARRRTAKPQARQPAPVTGVRPESGTPAQKTGHQSPYRHQAVTAQRTGAYSKNSRDVPVRPLSGHCTGFPEPLD